MAITEEEIKSAFSKNLQKILADRHLSKAELGRLLGYSRSHATDLVNGNKIPNLQTLCKCAEIFHVNINELLF